MITIYLKQYNKIIRNADTGLFEELGYDDILWIDMLQPTIKEQKAVENFMEINLQTKQQVEEIESTSKYSETENAIISNANFFVPTGESFVIEPVSFIISNEGVLVSVRQAESRTFQETEKRLQINYRNYPTGYHIFITLLEVRIDYDADMVELIARQVSSLSRNINGEDSIDKEVLRRINTLQESTMLLRENIFDRQRVLSGILRSERFPNDIYPRLQLMIKDVNSLINHADFSFQRLDYIQDAALGLILSLIHISEADGELVFPLQMVAQAAIGGVDTGGGGNGIVGGPITDIEHWWPEGQQPVGIDYEPWETKEQSGILLKTRWNQTKPYNYLCPIENGKNCFAGCVPVAVAQILVFNALNYNKKFYQIGDQLLNEAMWLNIEEAVTHPQLVKPVVSGESMNAQTWAVAYFINKMGEAVGVKYHSDDGGSPAPTKNVVKLLQYLGDIGLGYSNIALSPITTDKVRDMIFVKKLPFYYSGKSSTNSHAWVLDGWLLRERRVITRYAFLPTQYHTESKEFVHANFGWGGQKDGYYTFNAFYTDRGPVSPQSIEDRDYDHDFSAVTYNLSK